MNDQQTNRNRAMTRDQILAKIRKCLALSSSSEPHEAAAALRQARALMDKYGMSEDDVAASTIGIAATKAAARPKPYQYMLAAAVERAVGVKAVWMTGGALIVFVGREPATDIATYAWTVLTRALEQARRRHVTTLTRCKTSTKRRRGEAFAQGWVLGVRTAVEQFGGIDAATDHAIQVFLDQHLGDAETTKTKLRRPRARDTGSANAGYREGRRQQLNRPLNGGTELKRLGN